MAGGGEVEENKTKDFSSGSSVWASGEGTDCGLLCWKHNSTAERREAGGRA